MNPEYKKIISRSKAVKKEKAEIVSQIASTKDTMNEDQKVFDEIKAEFGDIVLKGEAKEIVAAEGKMNKITNQLIRRNQAKLQAFEKNLASLKEEEAMLNEQRIRVLGKLTRSWLIKTGIPKRDRNAKATISSDKELQAAHQIVREIGNQAIFIKTVGDVFPFLVEAKIPVIKGFSRGQYVNGPRFQVTDAIYNKVFSEIVD
jgi:hypothetical protein